MATENAFFDGGSSPPSTATIDREALAQRVVSAVGSIATKLTELEADLRLLWVEFENLSDGETILGCSTKKEFCETKLHRTPRAVQYLLKGGNAANMAQRRENISLPPAPEPEPAQSKVHPDSKRFGDALKKAVAADRKRNDATAVPAVEDEQIAERAQLEITEDEARAIFANKNGEVLSEKTSPRNRNYYYITFERGGRFWRFNICCERGYKPQPEGLNRIKRDDVVSIVCAEVFPVIVTEYRTREELEESGETVAASAPTPEPAIKAVPQDGDILTYDIATEDDHDNVTTEQVRFIVVSVPSEVGDIQHHRHGPDTSDIFLERMDAPVAAPKRKSKKVGR
jgi:hypothetical protein